MAKFKPMESLERQLEKINSLENSLSIENNMNDVYSFIDVIHESEFEFRERLETEWKNRNVNDDDYLRTVLLLDGDGDTYENPFIKKAADLNEAHCHRLTSRYLY